VLLNQKYEMDGHAANCSEMRHSKFLTKKASRKQTTIDANQIITLKWNFEIKIHFEALTGLN
jgi:hypothetical protein